MEDKKKIFEECMNSQCDEIDEIPGGLTNTSYKILSGDEIYVMRIPGVGTNEYIDRGIELNNMSKLNDLDIIPHIYYSNTDTGIIISKFIRNNRELNKDDLYNNELINQMNTSLAALHQSNRLFDDEFDIEVKIKEYQAVLKNMNCSYPDEVNVHLDLLEGLLNETFKKYPKQLVPCHIDPKLSNFLLSDGKIYMIDWEYSGNADLYFDLANMTLTNELSEEQERLFLESYTRCSKIDFIEEKYILYKILTDYLWIFWHLIKWYQGQMVEYNSRRWKERLDRALAHYRKLGGIK